MRKICEEALYSRTVYSVNTKNASDMPLVYLFSAIRFGAVVESNLDYQRVSGVKQDVAILFCRHHILISNAYSHSVQWNSEDWCSCRTRVRVSEKKG